MLVTEKAGKLLLISDDDRSKVPVAGVPKVAYGGQGGLGDVIAHPDYASNRLIYFSYAEEDSAGKKGAAVAMARFSRDSARPALKNVRVIWRQEPKTTGSGHYSHRLAFGPDGMLYVAGHDTDSAAAHRPSSSRPLTGNAVEYGIRGAGRPAAVAGNG